MNRGNARGDGQDLGGALADYGQAIDLMDALRRQLGAEWPPAWANDLAGAYLNRGTARYAGQDLGGALADYGQAIELREALRRQLGAEWPPAWANALAAAYLNRGVARYAGQDLGGALADYGQAIELMEALRRQLGAEWPPAWANDLAGTYMNRGIAREQAGDLAAAIEDWDAAATIYLKRVEQGGLPAGADLLKAIYWVLGGCLDLANWPSAAQCLLAFMALYQQLEAQWRDQHGELEPPWRKIVGQFAGAVHGLNPDQRAALLAALGEKAEAVKQAFGWT
ncbi:MAG: hypothetical protein P9F75_15390, partial [Candidatus Contendobacter sp.]|nr:hypothetical protein [Candidatus Contendobacter sp.]